VDAAETDSRDVPRKSRESARRYYNARDDYGVNRLRRQKILNLCKSEPGRPRRILDLGCAAGYLARELKTEGTYVVGLDVSEKAVEAAKGALDEAFVMDIESEVWPADFLERKFDLILCAELIEHLFDQTLFLEKLKRILSADGAVVFSTPNFLVWTNRLRMLFGEYGLRERFFDPGHIQLLSYLGFLEKLRASGYRVLAQDHLWHPPMLDRFPRIVPPNLFVYQSIVKAGLRVDGPEGW
jgi:2-polyprenyl-3-methyl-5-hydroxy-6-metoxy-1,4-benzoquinol methylase